MPALIAAGGPFGKGRAVAKNAHLLENSPLRQRNMSRQGRRPAFPCREDNGQLREGKAPGTRMWSAV